MNKPPVILRSSKLEGSLPLFLFAGLILFSWTVSNTISFFPSCWLRKWTGIPCPFCGGTRCLLAWSHLEWGEAFQLNPMVFFACIGIVVWFGLWIAGKRFRKLEWAPLKAPIPKSIFVLIFFVAWMLNWLYLYWHTR